MLAEERIARIRREMARWGRIEVTSFAASTGFSQMTIRRDLAAMAAAGEVRRVRGGAVPLHPERFATASPGGKAPLGSLGLIVPNSRRFASGVIRGAAEAAKDAGFTLLVGSSLSSLPGEQRQIQRMHGAGVDGLLLLPSTMDTGAAVPWAALRDFGSPVVVIEPGGTTASGTMPDTVTTDHRSGAFSAMAHLSATGEKRIGLLAVDASNAAPLREGYLDAVHAFRLDGSAPCLVTQRARDLSALRGTVKTFVNECLLGETRAVLIGSEEAATLVIAELHERGIEVGTDFHIVAYGDELAPMSGNATSAIALPSAAIGRAAVESCLWRLGQRHPSPAAAPPHLGAPRTCHLCGRRRTARPAAGVVTNGLVIVI